MIHIAFSGSALIMHVLCHADLSVVSSFSPLIPADILTQVCSRLPCDRRCEKQLKCGHRCPSGMVQ